MIIKMEYEDGFCRYFCDITKVSSDIKRKTITLKNEVDNTTYIIDIEKVNKIDLRVSY